jgi:hypothetical protein
MPIIINIGDSYHSVWQLGTWSQNKMLMNRALKLLLLFNFNMISQRHARHNHSFFLWKMLNLQHQHNNYTTTPYMRVDPTHWGPHSCEELL